ncbi:glycoside hydrolase family 105 [Lecanosticta acicola]|uniref:Glycoside hydrolase family 105 n=1 Tax=Lecanosticta acicola TaxID=111012 RepID=A0AAI8Z382_9PEZI|nr:glycoside hydrolase family 105 [Lecanosticta acicola]
MKLSILASISATAAALTPGEYLTWAADSFVQRGVDKDFSYQTSVLYYGYQAAINLTSNQTYVDWYQSQIDGIVLDNGTIADWNYTYYSLDDYRIGTDFLWWYNRTGEEKYKSAADIIREQLNRHPRNREGGFFHRSPIYAWQMWLDGIFMADSFYAQWTALFDNGNTTAWDHIVKQYDLIERHCRNQTTGLLVHGYDESKTAVWANPVTGAAPNVWSRAVGWYLISLLEVIPYIPSTHPGKEKLTSYYTTLASAVKAHQDTSGGWWLVMNAPYPAMEGNYIESSASAMFTYGLFAGMRNGLLNETEYYPTATKGYELLTSRFVESNSTDGTLNWEGTVEIGSLGSNGTFEYYISVDVDKNDYKGVGPFMLSSQPYLNPL